MAKMALPTLLLGLSAAGSSFSLSSRASSTFSPFVTKEARLVRSKEGSSSLMRSSIEMPLGSISSSIPKSRCAVPASPPRGRGAYGKAWVPRARGTSRCRM